MVQDFMAVLVTCKIEEDPIKTEAARVVTTLKFDISNAQGQLRDSHTGIMWTTLSRLWVLVNSTRRSKKGSGRT